MAKKRVPVPKTQEQISQESIDGTPTNSLNEVQKKGIRRANAIKLDSPSDTPFHISLEDHDYAIEYYLKHRIKPILNINGNQTEVPVMYSSPERWKAIQKDGYLRDQDGRAILPLITYRKLDFEKLRYTSKIDAGKPLNFYVTANNFNQKDAFSKFVGLHSLQNRGESTKYNVVVVPDYIRISYSIRVFTEYVSHMNTIQELITYASDSYWGEQESFKFKTVVKRVGILHEVPNGDDRLLTSDIDLDVFGYIIPESAMRDALTSPIEYGKSKVKISVETALTKEQIDEFQSKIQNGSI